MKQAFLKGMAGALTLTLLAAGCGQGSASSSASSGGEEAAFTLEDIRKNNTVEAALSRHSAFSYQQDTYLGEDSQPVSSTMGQYRREGGKLQFYAAFHDRDGGVAYQQGYADDTYPGALYETSNSGEKYLTLYPQGEYEAALSALWSPAAVTEEGEQETLDSCTLQDGVVVVTSTTTYRQEAEYYERNLYYLEPDTGLLLYQETTSYTLSQGQSVPDVPYGQDTAPVMSVTKTTVTYDDPFTQEADPHGEILDENGCRLTLTVAPQGAEEVLQYPVAQGTHIFFQSQEGAALYLDEDLSQDVTDEDLTADGPRMELFAVPGE